MKTAQHDSVIENILFSSDELERFYRIQNKQASPVYEIAFCGHFSAGKSTILNELIGENILPVSPIPTSANIIRIQNGALKLEAKMAEETGPRIFKNEIPWNRVREWGRNGQDIEHLRVYVPLPWLSKTAVISDTPGVDSTDPTHGDVTVDQLYTTDMVVYVMDYNHVQSETNLHFLKQLTDERKPVMIVINQIDKHSENELTLDAFKSSIRKTFLSWKIKFQDIFLLSMKQSDNPMNEWPRFQNELKSLMYYNDHLIEDAAKRLNIGFYERVRKRIIEDIDHIIEEYNGEILEIRSSPDELKTFEDTLERYQQALEFQNRIQEDYQRKQEKLFKNIVLFPHKIRELTKVWLESEGKSRKPGIWFMKKKWQVERDKQTDVLITELNDQIQTQLAFHIKKYFINDVDLHYIKDVDAFQKKVYDTNIIIDESLLTSFRKKGPVSDAYLFHFTDQITTHIVSEWKKQAEDLINEVLDHSRIENEVHIVSLQNQLDSYNHLRSLYNEIEDRKSIYYRDLEQIESILDDLKSPTDYYRLIDDIRNRAVDYKEKPEKLNLIDDGNPAIEKPTEIFPDELIESDYDVAFTNKRIKQFSDLLKLEKPGTFLEDERNQLHSQVNRHINQEFVISLFGAFSSGKSSFANALIGNDLLPVSPQPATASISEIRKSDELHQHGTIVVQFKTKAELEDELHEAGKLLYETLTIEGLKKWDSTRGNQKKTIHQSTLDYVSILQRGLEKNAEMLEREIKCSIDDLGLYAADEQVACLVERLTVFYDCDLTEKGITLIDTPGVNSIHSRHTRTALKQLNQSDAIFF
ncbi:dynamin family protein [Salisediminibacterium beveridgei]|nr:dynamin family protein [Salisediminibacterium beveridgei]